MGYASQQWTENLISETLIEAKKQGLLGGGGEGGGGAISYSEDQLVDNHPLGTIIAYFGQTAPANYLACDGKVYDIKDYQELADFIKLQFGNYNKFGGDGTTTFAVPDLTNKFLKGAAAAGEEEEAGLPNITGSFNHDWGTYHNNYDTGAFKIDPRGAISNAGTSGGGSTDGIANFDASISNPIYGNSDTVTPENISVIYCIKCRNVDIDLYLSYDDYDEEERVIGKWINGKPLYRRAGHPTNAVTLTTKGQQGTFTLPWLENSNIDFIVKFEAGSATTGVMSQRVAKFTNTSVTISHMYADGMGFGGNTGYCVVYYTKATDEENSFIPAMVTNNVKVAVAPYYEDHSEDEIVIGKWVDGRPVYRKWFINIDMKTSNGSNLKNVPHGIQNLDKVIKMDGIMARTSGQIITMRDTWDTTYRTDIRVEGDNLCLANGSFVGMVDAYIEYTKTTDEPNSFKPEMIGSSLLIDEVTDGDVADVLSVLV